MSKYIAKAIYKNTTHHLERREYLCTHGPKVYAPQCILCNIIFFNE